MIPSELPEYPWQKVGTDLFHFRGATYLLVVDYFSRYPEIVHLSNTTSSSIVNVLKTIFSRQGIPEIVLSDNGPQYASSEFADFVRAYDFKHVTTSPNYAQSNGQAERTLQTVKNACTARVTKYALSPSSCVLLPSGPYHNALPSNGRKSGTKIRPWLSSPYEKRLPGMNGLQMAALM